MVTIHVIPFVVLVAEDVQASFFLAPVIRLAQDGTLPVGVSHRSLDIAVACRHSPDELRFAVRVNTLTSRPEVHPTIRITSASSQRCR